MCVLGAESVVLTFGLECGSIDSVKRERNSKAEYQSFKLGGVGSIPIALTETYCGSSHQGYDYKVNSAGGLHGAPWNKD